MLYFVEKPNENWRREKTENECKAYKVMMGWYVLILSLKFSPELISFQHYLELSCYKNQNKSFHAFWEIFVSKD